MCVVKWADLFNDNDSKLCFQGAKFKHVCLATICSEISCGWLQFPGKYSENKLKLKYICKAFSELQYYTTIFTMYFPVWLNPRNIHNK